VAKKKKKWGSGLGGNTGKEQPLSRKKGQTQRSHPRRNKRVEKEKRKVHKEPQAKNLIEIQYIGGSVARSRWGMQTEKQKDPYEVSTPLPNTLKKGQKPRKKKGACFHLPLSEQARSAPAHFAKIQRRLWLLKNIGVGKRRTTSGGGEEGVGRS